MSLWQEHNLAEITQRLAPLCRSPQGILFERSSPNNHIVVRHGQEQILLCYRHRDRYIEEVQSRIDPTHPLRLLSPYTQAMMLALLWCPQPKRILLIGLGGGRLQLVLHHVLENVRLETVELDPLVLEVAGRFFGFLPDERQRVSLSDGRAFLREEAADAQYDVIFLDAYQAEGVPSHLLTLEFYAECCARLCPNGLVVANLHSSTPMYDASRKTFAAAFKYTTACFVSSGNVVVLGSEETPLHARVLRKQAGIGEKSYGGVFPFSTWARDASLRAPYRSNARILRDSVLYMSV